jgi:hypothetical protein
LLFTLPASAQFDTGTISGLVTDGTGAVIPHSSVTITNTGTGIQTTANTDSSGSFVASGLPFGHYVVSAIATGFGKATAPVFVLNVGATVRVSLVLAVAAASESVEVTGTATTIDTSSSTSGSTLDSTQIGNLPVNGRDVSDFLEISPGSVGSTAYFQGSVNGLDNIFTGLNIKLDGQSASRGDVNGFLETEGQEGARVTRASVDSIQEIDFANSGYSAEGGFSLGPQMNIITKAGTNNFHGTAFEFLRNEDLDARDYFAPGEKVPLKLNQFGVNLAGPIFKKKLFFFVNYEGDRTHLTNIEPHYEVPSAYVRSQFVPSMQPILALMAPLPSGCGLGSSTATCDYDTRYPDGSTYDLVYTPTSLKNTVREDTGSVRLDYHISDNDTVMFRYNINDSSTSYEYGTATGQVSPQALRTQLAKIDETHIFSPTLLNEFSLAVNRFYSNTESNTGQPYVSIASFFTNLGSLPGANAHQINANTLPEMFDNVTKTAGAHTLKLGVQYRLNRLNTWQEPIESYEYYSFQSLETNFPYALVKQGTPGSIGNRNSNLDFYAQDDWRVNHKLTVNIGLRYDANTTWNVAHGNQRQFIYATQTFGSDGQSAYNVSKIDFAPRIGFSYDPFGRGKTVIHGYGGMFYMPMQPSPNTLADNMPANASITDTIWNLSIFGGTVDSISYPTLNPPLLPSNQNVFIFPTNPKDPYSTNWLFGIQQEIARGTVLTVNYVGNKVQHTQAGVAYQGINLNPSNPNTNVGRILAATSPYQDENYMPNNLFSNYNALQAQLRRNMKQLTLEANYTWSHEIDDEVNVFAGFSDPFKPTLDRSSGDWDARQNFTASVLYNLPELKNSSRLVRETLGGWQTSSIIQTRSGLAQNVEVTNGFFGNYMRPNRVADTSLKVADAKWPSSSYNINAFTLEPGFDGVWGDPTTLGNIGRNYIRGPAFFQWDFSGMKNFAITGKVKMQFRADIFNILNHPNFSNIDTGICSSVTYTSATSATCTPNTPTYSNGSWTGFGVSSATIAGADGSQIGNGTARQAQFSLKLTF